MRYTMGKPFTIVRFRSIDADGNYVDPTYYTGYVTKLHADGKVSVRAGVKRPYVFDPTENPMILRDLSQYVELLPYDPDFWRKIYSKGYGVETIRAVLKDLPKKIEIDEKDIAAIFNILNKYRYKGDSDGYHI